MSIVIIIIISSSSSRRSGSSSSNSISISSILISSISVISLGLGSSCHMAMAIIELMMLGGLSIGVTCKAILLSRVLIVSLLLV